MDRAAEDLQFFQHDRAIFPPPEFDTKGLPVWKGSQAQKKLRKCLEEIASGKTDYQKPRLLRKDHDEFQVYPLEIFRKKIYQEIKFSKRQKWLEEKFGTATEKDIPGESNEG